jgi:hypothetical protein
MVTASRPSKAVEQTKGSAKKTSKGAAQAGTLKGQVAGQGGPLTGEAAKTEALDPSKRKVLYPEVAEKPYIGDIPLTVEDAKFLLGWEEVPGKPPMPQGKTRKKGKKLTGDGDGAEAGAADEAASQEEEAALAAQVEQERKDYEAALAAWNEANEGKAEPILTDRCGVLIRCTKNVTNRPLYLAKVEELAQEMLNKRWVFNGEPIIIGKTGLVLNGQHQLIALCLAEQDRAGPQDGEEFTIGNDKARHNAEHWQGKWDGPVTIEKVVVFGVDESDRVVNTMDTCKPRSLADVLYRSKFFVHLRHNGRKVVARALEYCLKQVWARVGGADPYAHRRTHAEALDFVLKHPTLLDCVNHIFQLDSGKKAGKKADTEAPGSISKNYLTAGYASAMCYLMSASASDYSEYHRKRQEGEAREEGLLDFSAKPTAFQFWADLQRGEPNMRAALGHCRRPAQEGLEGGLIFGSREVGGVGTVAERIAVICNAWNMYVEGHDFNLDGDALDRLVPADMYQEVKMSDDSIGYALAYMPTVGGIDIGDPNIRRYEVKDTIAEAEETGETEVETEYVEQDSADLDELSGIGEESESAPAPAPKETRRQVLARDPSEDRPDVLDARKAAVGPKGGTFADTREAELEARRKVDEKAARQKEAGAGTHKPIKRKP